MVKNFAERENQLMVVDANLFELQVLCYTGIFPQCFLFGIS